MGASAARGSSGLRTGLKCKDFISLIVLFVWCKVSAGTDPVFG
jgi:hypothetical protein